MLIYLLSGCLCLAEAPAPPRREFNVRSSWDDPNHRRSAGYLIGFYHSTFQRLQKVQKKIEEAKEGEVSEKDIHLRNACIRGLKSYRDRLSLINDPKLTESTKPPTQEELREIEIILKTPIPEPLPLPKGKE